MSLIEKLEKELKSSDTVVTMGDVDDYVNKHPEEMALFLSSEIVKRLFIKKEGWTLFLFFINVM